MIQMLRKLLLYRFFILSSIRTDLINRFARSKLGGLWMLINPLAQVAIYAIILSNILAARLPEIDNKYGFAIYLMAGLLAWTLFSETVSQCLNLFLEKGNIIKKMQFPIITLPVIVMGTCLLNNALLFISMVFIFVLLGHHFDLVVLWLLPLTLLLAFFSVGLGLILGVLNVFIRDIGQAIPIILQMLFWFTPIIYPISIIPEGYRHWLYLNPMYYFTNSHQEVIVFGRAPQIESILIIGLLSGLLLLLSLFIYRRASAELVDVL
jgi:lipopolysaccharide transport system permease protein